MTPGLLPGSVVAMSSQAVDRLLKRDEGDAALLYLHLLRQNRLPAWEAGRLERALAGLRALGMAPAQPAPPAQQEPPELPPPEYALEDITAALKDPAASFAALADEVERLLGRKLSAADLKGLYTLYDHLGLPPEVILMLVNWCGEEMARKYGPGRPPLISQIRKEGFAWARRGVDTIEQAEAHIQRLSRLRERGSQVLRLLDIPPRPLVRQEQSYISAWDEWGFGDEALRLAYEKTIMKKQRMDWSYMNAILRRWHESGLHTPQEIRERDRTQQPSFVPAAPRTDGGAQAQQARADMERMRRLMEQMKQEEK